ncbi:MAG: SDR family NAD(P)-dependent oxidoreductase [Candidatus Jordarchaeum sp.]|uniref:SDR family NAD(P)-dependent oxidoreductase n=1 Tax=Candidatus Jordarchaeum sp. TaxID=2823881 RepID=UPI00404A74AE
MNLVDKTAVIVGGGGGIGKHIALTFASEGAKVVVGDIDGESAEKVASEITSKGGKSLALKVDIRKEADISDMIKKTEEKFGAIDILVNVTRIASLVKMVDLSEEQWDTVVDYNAKGLFFLCKAVAREMAKNNKGKMIIISSTAGISGQEQLSHYAASMGAVIGFARSLGLELAGRNIKVNIICPGYLETRELKLGAQLKAGPSVEEDTIVLFSPLHQIDCEPEAIAKMAVFLASEKGDYFSNETYRLWDDEVTFSRNMTIITKKPL